MTNTLWNGNSSDERVAITGNTYPVKDRLKALGARWNPELRAWMVPRDRADEAQAIVDSAPRAQRARTGGGETKRCWECGREFTSYDAYRNEGDWSNGYCGC